MTNYVTEDQLLKLMKQLDRHGKDLLPSDALEEKESAKAWLQIKDGKIAFIPAERESEGDWPIAEAVPPLKLVVNGKTVEGLRQIMPGDEVSWHAEQKKFRIDISPDKMKAWLLLFPDGRCQLRPADQEKTTRLVLRATEDPSLPLSLPTIVTLVEAVKELGLPFFDREAMRAELWAPGYVPVLIAKGKEPVPGKNASLEIFFSEQIESSFEEINGLIDYRNHSKIPSVRMNDLIARKSPLVEGEAGFDVFGNPLPAPQPKDLVLLGRQFVKIVGNEAYALKDGRPRITGDRVKMISITTSHVVAGDVDMKTGNVVFSGDIHIYGNVNDGMIVEALGDVYVGGNVYRATISATGSIYIKGNTLGSQLYSGHFGVLFNRLYNFSTRLNERFTLYRQVAAQLRELAEKRGQVVAERQVFQLLLETKFRDITDLCRSILGCIASIQSIRNGAMDNLKNALEEMLKPAFLQQESIQSFVMELQNQLIRVIELVRLSEESQVVTEIQQCHLTEIMSNGDILIRKQGVLQSQLYSKENIVFFEKDSVCRGSHLEAGDTISAMIVGGVSGGSTSLKAGKKVMASLIYEGKVTIDRYTRDILEPIEKVSFSVKDNRMIAEPFNATGELQNAAT